MAINKYITFSSTQVSLLAAKQLANNVAIACAVTSKAIASTNISQHPLIKEFLAKFCTTASVGYDYSFYLRYLDQITISLKNTIIKYSLIPQHINL